MGSPMGSPMGSYTSHGTSRGACHRPWKVSSDPMGHIMERGDFPWDLLSHPMGFSMGFLVGRPVGGDKSHGASHGTHEATTSDGIPLDSPCDVPCADQIMSPVSSGTATATSVVPMSYNLQHWPCYNDRSLLHVYRVNYSLWTTVKCYLFCVVSYATPAATR